MREPTSEQKSIVEAGYTTPGLTAVNAYAGSGKTSTLEMVAAANPKARILYLCFNKALSEDSKKKFPANVEVRTTHSLAYGHMINTYREKGISDMRPAEIATMMGIGRRNGLAVRDTLKTYLQSPDPGFTEEMIPQRIRMSKRFNVDEILADTKAFWERMKDPTDLEAKISHDGYLKLWVMQQPRLRHDIILLDEAQDTTPTVERLVLGQMEHKAVVLVGDRHQSLYQWRGACNSMERTSGIANRSFNLTTAFRLREEAAEMATSVIKRLGDYNTIKPGNTGPYGAKGGTSAILARTNAQLLLKASELVDNEEGSIHFVGTKSADRYDPNSIYNFDEIMDIHWLRKGRYDQVQTQYMKFFNSYSEIKEMVNVAGGCVDTDLMMGVTLVEKHQDDLPELLRSVRAACVAECDAVNILTTTHKSKGLEWDIVELQDDFLSLEQERELRASNRKGVEQRIKDELNILYVALTRGRDKVKIPDGLV